MLFRVTWDFIDSSEAGRKRSLQLFSKWQPGPAQFQAFYDFVDGGGGFALVEASSASDLAKTMAPWNSVPEVYRAACPANSRIR